MLNFKKDNFSAPLFISASLICLLLVGISVSLLKVVLIEPDNIAQENLNLNQLTPDPLITIAPNK